MELENHAKRAAQLEGEIKGKVCKYFSSQRIVQFRIRLDRWLKALRTHFYRVNLDLK